MDNVEQPVTTVDYETFKQDPARVLRMSDRNPVEVVDENGEQMILLSVVSSGS